VASEVGLSIVFEAVVCTGLSQHLQIMRSQLQINIGQSVLYSQNNELIVSDHVTWAHYGPLRLLVSRSINSDRILNPRKTNG